MYNRIFLAELSAPALTLMVLKDLSSSFYNFVWKYHPSEIVLRLAYFMPAGGPLPVMSASRQPLAIHGIRKLLASLTYTADDILATLFTSSFFEIDFNSGR